MKASSLLLREKTVLEVISFIVTVFEIPVGGREFLWYLLGALADY